MSCGADNSQDLEATSDLDATDCLQQAETHLRAEQHPVPLLMAHEHWPISYVTGSAQKADKVYLADLPVFIFSTFLTIFCSSIKNARMILQCNSACQISDGACLLLR